MGAAQYNRGSKAISDQVSEELAKAPHAFVARDLNGIVFHTDPIGPQMPTLKYWNLCEDPRMVEVGDRVYCTVYGCRVWDTVISVKGTRRNLRIKTEMGPRSWGYASNYTFNPPGWMTK